MDYKQKFEELEEFLKSQRPDFEVRYKDECKGLTGLIPRLVKGATVSWFGKVYFSSRARVENNYQSAYFTLAHEGVHILDDKRFSVLFSLGYIFPQILASLSLLSILAILNPAFLLFLLALLFLAPIPAPFRTWAELRGYGMSIKVRNWAGYTIGEDEMEWYASHFWSALYYFMWPFKGWVRRKLAKYNNNKPVMDNNPVYAFVYNQLQGTNETI